MLDLIVNGPLKAHIRGLRATRIYNYFQQFKCLYDEEKAKPKELRKMPKWSCQKPSLHQCIGDLIHLFQHGAFIEPKFKESIKNSFITTGCAPDINGFYKKYNENSNKGNFDIIPSGTVSKTEFPISNNDNYFVDLVNMIDGDDIYSDAEDE